MRLSGVSLKFCSVPFHFLSAFSVMVTGCCGVFPPKGPNPVLYSMGVGQGTPWMSRQLIAGPRVSLKSPAKITGTLYTYFVTQKSC